MGMANFATALHSFEFAAILAACDKGLREKLESLGIASATIFANLVLHDPGSDEATEAFKKLTAELTKDPELRHEWFGHCLRLHLVAVSAAPMAHARVARLSGFQLSADFEELKVARKRSAEEHDLRRLALHSLAELPKEWRRKRYRRTLGQPTEHA